MGEDRRVQDFGGKATKQRDHLEDRGKDGKMGSKWILRENGWAGGWSGFKFFGIGAILNAVIILWFLAARSYLVSHLHSYFVSYTTYLSTVPAQTLILNLCWY
jgi:hypothetical protein